MKKKITHGGARSGSGAKSKYGEPTVNITIRVPESKKETVRKLVADYLEAFIKRPGSVEVTNEMFNPGFGAFDVIKSGGYFSIEFDQAVKINGPFTIVEGQSTINCVAVVDEDNPYKVIIKAKKSKS